MKIVLAKYNPEWKILFETEKLLLSQILSKIEIEHIGSTAVEGLAAKPVIDIMMGLNDFNLANELIQKIENMGYSYVSKYEDTMPYRRFFTKDSNKKRTHQIHMVEIESDFWAKHLFFRDYLRMNKADRDKYSALKQELSTHDWKDVDEYANAKTSFIKSIVSKMEKTNR